MFVFVLFEVFEVVDAKAARVLKLNLTNHKIINFHGPLGWAAASVSTGHLGNLTGRNWTNIPTGGRDHPSSPPARDAPGLPGKIICGRGHPTNATRQSRG